MIPLSKSSRLRRRTDLLAKSALCGVLASALAGMIATRANALPVQAGTTPQYAGGGYNGTPSAPNISTVGGTMTVGTNASRTLINWTSYTVSSGQSVNYTFNSRSDIVLNVLTTSSPVQISGGISSTVNGDIGGNVWFSAPGGVIFGSGATVNVGGLLATTATIASSDFLNTSSSSFPFAFSSTGYPGGTGTPAVSGFPTSNTVDGTGGVTVESGATIQTHGGLLALIAPFVNVQSGGVVTSLDETNQNGGAGSVLYGAANAFIVTLSTETTGDLDMLQFVIKSPSDVTDNPLLLQGSTQGPNVYVASLSGSDVASAVIDATGSINANQASAGQGGEIILSTASDTINAASYNNGTYTPGSATNTGTLSTSAVDLEIATLSTSRDLQVYSSGAILGSNGGNYIYAGGDVTLSAADSISLDNVGYQDYQPTSVTITANGGDLSLGSIATSGNVSLTAPDGAVSITGTVFDASSTLSLLAGGNVTIQAGGGVTLTNPASVTGSFTATSTNVVGGITYGDGGVTVSGVTAGGAIDLEGAEVYATSLTSTGGGVTAIAYPILNDEGGQAYVDIGTVAATGGITLNAQDGYASLTGVTFNGSGQTLSITSGNASGQESPPAVYLGYAQASQGSGQQGQTGQAGGIAYGSNGSGATINLSSAGDVDVSVNTDIVLNTIASGTGINLASSGSLTVASDLNAPADINIDATTVDLQNVTSTNGSVTLTGGAGGISFGAGSANENFIATAISGSPGSDSGAGTGTGAITATGDVTATFGYIDLEGTNVSVGNLTAGGVNGSNNDYIYAAAWGNSNSSPGTLTYTSTTPAYDDSSQVFLYPQPPGPPAPPALPAQDTDSPPQVDSNGADPTISGTSTLGDGNFGETVTLNAKRTVIDWTNYVIGSGGEVDYVFNPVEGQSVSNARGNIVLNRITGGGQVDVEGVLSSTVAGDTQAYGGNVWFSAPGGIVFGSGAVVNVGGLLATTASFSPTNLTNQFLNPSVFTFTLDAGTGFPSGSTGYPYGTGYPSGEGYPLTDSSIGVTVESGAEINGSGSLVALVAPFVEVQSGAEVSDLDVNGLGAASVLYAAAPSFTLAASQPNLGGDPVNGPGDIDFASLAIGTSDLSGYATPLTLDGTTNALNVYVAALSPSAMYAGSVTDATGAITAITSASGAGGEIILSTGADTIVAGQAPVSSTAAINTMQLDLDNVIAGGPLRILSSGGINASADPDGVLQSTGGLTLSAAGDIQLSNISAGGNFTATATVIESEESYSYTYGRGAISANTIVAGGSVDLEGSSVVATAVTAGTANGAAGTITANAYDTPTYSNEGAASVDIGSATAAGNITLDGADGYASLTNVTFTGTGQTLGITARGYNYNLGSGDPAYFGYAQGGPTANNGAGPTAGVGSVTGSGTINMFSEGDADLNVAANTGVVTVGSVTANNTANLTADALTITGIVQGYQGTSVTARTGDLNANELDSTFGDVNATATLGSVYLTTTTANNVYVVAAQTASVTNAVTQTLYDDPINITGASVYLGTGNSQDAINLTATNGNATAGDLTAQGAITISATNGVASVHSATAGTPQASYFDPSPTPTPITLTMTATGTGADVVIGGPDTNGNIGFVTGATSITAQAAEDVTVNVNQPIELNLVSAGRNATLTAPSLTLDSLQGALTGTLDITVSDDAFTYTSPLTAGGGVSVSASAALSLGNVTGSGGAVTLTGSSVNAGALTASGAVDVTANTGALALTSVAAGGGVILEAPAGAITLASTLQANGGAATLQSGGAITLGGAASASGNFTATATATSGPTTYGVGALTAGAITAGGSVDIEGSSVFATAVTAGSANGAAGTITAIAYDNATDSNAGNAFVDLGSVTAPGNVTITASDGYASLTSVDFTGANAGAGQTLSLQSTGAPKTVYLGYSQGGPNANSGAGPTGAQGSVTGDGAITIYSNGSVAADVAGALTLGNVTAQQAINLTADSVTGDILSSGGNASPTAASITVAARTGGIDLNVVYSIYGPVSLNAAGAVNASSVYGDGVDIVAGGLADIASVGTGIYVLNGSGGFSYIYTSSAPIQITGAQVTVDQAFGYGPFTASATNGAATIGDVEFGGGAVSISAVNGLALLHSASPYGTGLNFTSEETAQFPQTQPSAVSVTASGTGASVVIGNPGGTGDLFSGLGFVTGAASITAQAAQDVTVNVGQAITLNSVSAGRNLTLTAPSLTLDSLQGALTGNIGILVADNGFTYASPLTAGGAVSVSASGALSLGDVTGQGGAVSLSGASVTAGTIVSSGAATVFGLSGDVTIGNGAAQSIQIAAEGSITSGALTAGSLSTGAGFIDLRAGLESASAVQPNAAGAINTGALVAGDFISILSAPAGVTVASAQTSANYQTEGWVHILGYTTGPIQTPYATTDTYTASIGPITIGAVSGASGVRLVSSGALDVTGAIVSGGVVSLEGTSVTGGDASAGAITSDGSTFSANATSGGLSLGNITSQAPNGVSIDATGGIALGSITSQAGLLSLQAGTNLSAGAVNSSGAVSVTAGTGAIALTSLTSGGAATLSAPSGAITLASTLQANGGDATLTSGGAISLGGAASASGNFTATAKAIGSSATYYGLGAITAGAITAGGSVDLEGSQVFATAVTAGTANGAAGTVTAIAYDTLTDSNAGNAFVDLGSITAPGNMTLTAKDGYASLTSADFTGANGGAGQTLSMTSLGAPQTVYLGYGQGGAGANGGQGSVTGSGTIELTSNGAVAVNVAGPLALDLVDANGAVDITTGSSLSATYIQGSTVSVLATGGDITLTGADALGGPATLSAPAGSVSVLGTLATIAPTTGPTYVSGLVSGQGVTVTAAGSVQVTEASTSEPAGEGYNSAISINLSGSQVSLLQGTAFGQINLSASNGAASGGTLEAGSISISAVNGTASVLNTNVLSDPAPATPAPAVLSLTATGTNADVLLGSGPAFTGAAGAVGPFTTINLTAAQDVIANVANTVVLTSVQAGRDVTVTANGGLTLDSLSVGRNLSLTATSVNLATLSAPVSGDVDITATGGGFADASPLTAGGAAAISATGALALNSVTAQAGAVTLAGSTISAGAVNASGAVGATASAGAVDLTSVTAGAGVTLTAPKGAIAIASTLQANGGDATLASGGAISVGGAASASGDFTATATAINGSNTYGLGAITAGAITAGGSVDLEGASVFATAVTAGAANGAAGTITAIAYDNASGSNAGAAFVDLGSVSAPGAITLTANDGYASLGGATFTGANDGAGQTLTLTANGASPQTLYLGYGQGGAGANGGAGPTAAQGGVTGAGAIELTSNGAVLVNATGALALDQVTASGAVNITADAISANALSSGDVSSATPGAIDVTARTGAIALTSVVSGAGVSLTAPEGAITVASTLQANGGDATLTGGGDITLGGTASASGAFTATATTSSGGVTSGVGAITAGAITAGGSVDLEGSSVFATAVTAGAVNGAVGTITATAYDTPTGSNAGAAFVDLGSVTAPGDITLTANDGYASLTSATFTGANSGAGQTLTLASTGSPQTVYLGYAQGGAGSGGGSGAITGAGAIELTSNGAISVNTTGALALDQVNASGAINISADSVSVNGVYDNADDFGLSADGTVNLTARTGDLTLGAAESFYGPVSLTAAGAVNAGTVFGEGVEIGAGGVANINYVATVGGVANSDGSDAQAYFTSAPVQITGTEVTLNQGFSYGPFTLAASNGAATVGDIEVGGGAVSISAVNGLASLHSVSLFGNDVNLSSAVLDALPQPQASAVSVTATGTGADVLIGGMSSAGRFPGLGFVSGAASLSAAATEDVTVDVGGALALTSVQAGRNATITADQLSVGTLVAGQDAVLTTPNPDSGASAAGATLSASILAAGRDLTVSSGDALTVGSISAGRNLSLTAPSVSLLAMSSQPSGDIDITATGGGFTDSAALTAGGGVAISAAGPVGLGAVTALGGDIDVASEGAATVGAATASGNITIAATGGSASLSSATLTGGGLVSLSASGATSDVSLGQGVGFVQGAGQVNLQGGEDVIVAVAGPIAVASATAGRDLSVDATGAVSIGPSQAGRNLSLTGASVSLGALSSSLGGAVSIDAVEGGVTSASTAQITAAGAIDIAATGAVSTGALQSTGAGVAVAGTTVSTGAISAADAVTATASSGTLSIANLTTPAGASLSGVGVSVSSGQIGGDLAISSGGDATLGSITVGGALSLDATGLASFGSVNVSGAGQVIAGTLEIAKLLSAPTLSLEARNGALTVGGATAPTDGSMWISQADFSRLVATTALNLYAGSTSGTARGALVVSDLSLDPALTPNVKLLAAPGQTVSVTGAVAPTVNGGTFAIGSTTNAAWTPSAILISGALGAATRVSDTDFTGVQAFTQVTLSSAGDVLIGSSRFISLIQATPIADINIALNQPVGATATGAEVGKVYVAAGQLAIDAKGEVVQQNSSGSASSYSGLYLLNGASTTMTALSIDPPSVVDLFGSFVNASGVLTSGPQAARGTGLLVLGLPVGSQVPANYRFNGCMIAPDALCGVMVGPEQSIQPLEEQQTTGEAVATTSQLLSQPVLLTIAPLVEVEQQLDPLITGVGNEEIWRTRRPGEGSDK